MDADRCSQRKEARKPFASLTVNAIQLHVRVIIPERSVCKELTFDPNQLSNHFQ